MPGEWGTAGVTGAITVKLLPNTAVTQSDTTLTAVIQSGATYQWIDCATNQPVAGATGHTFTPTVTGSYAVVITCDGCTGAVMLLFRRCNYQFERVLGRGSAWHLHPNPNDGSFVIRNALSYTATFELRDTYGKGLGVYEVPLGEWQLRLMLPAGMYFLREQRSGTVQPPVGE